MKLSIPTVLITLFAAMISPANAALRGTSMIRPPKDEPVENLAAARSEVEDSSNAQDLPTHHRRYFYIIDSSKNDSLSSRRLDRSSSKSSDDRNNRTPAVPTGPTIDLNDGGCDCVVNKDGSFTCTGCGGRYLAIVKYGERSESTSGDDRGGRRLDSSSSKSSDDTNYRMPAAPTGPTIDLNDGGCDCVVNKDGSFTCTGCGTRYLAITMEDNERIEESSEKDKDPAV